MYRDITYTTKSGVEMTANIDFSVVRWESNYSVPPIDTLKDMLAKHLITRHEYECSLAARREDLEDYFDHLNHITAQEEKLGARAAYGAGVRVINIITGEEYIT